MIDIDLTSKRTMLGLSGGINSAALLCWLNYYPLKPSELFLFYADFEEHSDDTFDFVLALREYAINNFKKIKTKFTLNSVLEYFEEEKMIPHPMFSPCSLNLKIKPALKFYTDMSCEFDLIGYVKEDIRRFNKQDKKQKDLFNNKLYPIIGMTDDECLELVKKEIGWYPAIYDITENGKRLFNHNNCLPCKNMRTKDLINTSKYFPEKMEEALELGKRINSYWGRENVPAELICDHCQLID